MYAYALSFSGNLRLIRYFQVSESDGQDPSEEILETIYPFAVFKKSRIQMLLTHLFTWSYYFWFADFDDFIQVVLLLVFIHMKIQQCRK